MLRPFFDRNFRQRPAQFFFQCALAGLAITLGMVMHDLLASKALLASLGASCFLAFTSPHAPVSRPRRMIGGYACGAASGALCSLLAKGEWLQGVPVDPVLSLALVAGLGVALAMFLMVLRNAEHAPAAGVALGLVIDEWQLWNLLYVMAGIGILTLAKVLLRRVMADLV